MAPRPSDAPMRIELPEQARQRLVTALQALFADEFERELSDYQAQRLIDFFVRRLGAPVYNRAIQDARGFLLDKLEDLAGELYEPEETR